MSHLSGSVVFIDDEIELVGTSAEQLCRDIRASGRPVFATTELPPEDEFAAWFEHWQSLAFVVVDWDLSAGSNAAAGGTLLGDFTREKMFVFLRSLMTSIYCPVFVISSADTSTIGDSLRQAGGLVDADGELDRRIEVFPKTALIQDIVGHLEERVSKSPALSVLTAWEKQYDAAKNRLLIELDELEPDWPLYVWKSANDDGVDPDYELSLILTANLQSRLRHGAFEDLSMEGFEASVSRLAMRKVSHGRTTIGGDLLAPSMVLPGDIFRIDENDQHVWINVSPACQTIGRPAKAGEDARPIRLHLLRGTPAVRPVSNTTFKDLENRAKGPNGEIVHTLLDAEAPYYFDFGDVEIRDWDEIRELRIARLLSPYITRLQQKHAAYIQSEGLPKVSKEFYVDDSGAT